MSTDATQEAPTAESFVRRAMTADREQLKALFAEALGRATALTQENQRLRAGLQIISENYTKESNGPGRADWFQAIAREALKPKPSLVEELVP